MTGSIPWSTEDLVRWTLMMAVAAGLCVAGWWLASGHSRFNDQIVGINLGVVGLIVACSGHIGLFLRGRRLIGLRSRYLLVTEEADEDPPAFDGALVAGSGLRHYHLASCQLAEGRGWPVHSRAALEADGLRPCGVCRP
jgi:hypothetical protein